MSRSFFSKLRNFIVPHPHNNYEPHFFRVGSLLTILATIVVVTFAGLESERIIPQQLLAEVQSSRLVELSNQARTERRLAQLQSNPVLIAAAQAKADDMARNSYFAHVGPDGKQPWDWMQQVGYDYRYAGENLAVRFVDSDAIVEAWLGSPKHRANILTPKYTEIGIATARGMYKGKETTYVVQMLGRPLQPSAPTKTTMESPRLVWPDGLTATAIDAFDAGDKIASIGYDPVSGKPVCGSGCAVQQNSLAYVIFGNPLFSAATILQIIGIIIAIAMIILILVAIKKHRPKRIFYGLALLVLILLALYLLRTAGSTGIIA